jgi:hypothetical protein
VVFKIAHCPCAVEEETKMFERLRREPVPGIIRYFGTIHRLGTKILVLEKATRSLKDLLNNEVAHHDPVNTDILIREFFAIIHGLHKFHSLKNEHGNIFNLGHCNITPANILQLPNGGFSLCDFGQSFVSNSCSMVETSRDHSFLPPESVLNRNVGPKGDVFAFAHCLLLLLIWSLEGRASLESFQNNLRNQSVTELERLWAISIESGIITPFLKEVVNEKLVSLRMLAAGIPICVQALAIVETVLREMVPEKRLSLMELENKLWQVQLERIPV